MSIEKALAGSGSVTEEGVEEVRLCIRNVLSHDADTTQSEGARMSERKSMKMSWTD
jgi:hypothetical protein